MERTPSWLDSRLEKANTRWVRRFGLVDAPSLDGFTAIGCGNFARHTYPRASFEIAELAANLISWLVLFDDRHGEARAGVHLGELTERFATFEALVRTGARPANATPFHDALAELRERLAARADEAWLERFADSVSQYLDGCLLEWPFRRTGWSPTLARYRELRRRSVGAGPVFDLIELELGELLPPDKARTPELIELRELAAELCAWINDLYSYEKERADGDPINLLAVLMRERALTLEEARDAAARLYEADLRKFSRLERAFAERSETSLLEIRYAEGLGEWILGNVAWSSRSDRYQAVASSQARSRARRPR